MVYLVTLPDDESTSELESADAKLNLANSELYL